MWLQFDLNPVIVLYGRGAGRGLAPTHSLLIHVTVVYYMVRTIYNRIHICYSFPIVINMRAGFNHNQWLICITRGLTGGAEVIQRLNHFAQPLVPCAMCPDAEAVRGWRALNRPTVCTGARLCTGLSFYA
jgi:hypothetical protein